ERVAGWASSASSGASAAGTSSGRGRGVTRVTPVDFRSMPDVRVWTLCDGHAHRPRRQEEEEAKAKDDRSEAHVQGRHQEGARQEEAGEGLHAGQGQEEA